MNARETILTSIAVAFGLGLCLAVPAIMAFRRFLAEVPVIRSPYDLDRFKRLAARDMYMALAFIALVGIPSLAFGWGFTRGVISALDLIVPLGWGVPFALVGAYLKRLEARVQGTPAEDPALGEERDRVVHTWLHKPLPDW